ncbi:VASt domain-containing protein [Plasmodiophora brassicae]|uniref:VASt domain-containing protein n=1 Tax=Plasmodiophora brassicae TaxID=37360 RepID=A0A0G4IMB4_PLABS|nr:hypothetical protein PBRA_005057 [Plasmodiophora brassicae]
MEPSVADATPDSRALPTVVGLMSRLSAALQKYANALEKASKRGESTSTHLEAVKEFIGKCASGQSSMASSVQTLSGERDGHPTTMMIRLCSLFRLQIQQHIAEIANFHGSIKTMMGGQSASDDESCNAPCDAYRLGSELVRSGRALTVAISSVMRELAVADSKLSAALWRGAQDPCLGTSDVSVNSMAKLLTRLAEGHESLSACITADCHDIVSCHTDITDNENQVEVNDALWAQTSTDAWSRKAFHSALHLQSSTDPTDMPAALALVGTARSLHSQRLSSVEDALIRFAEARLALVNTSASAINAVDQPESKPGLPIEADVDEDADQSGIAHREESAGTGVKQKDDSDPCAVLNVDGAASSEEAPISSYSCALLKKGFPIHGRLAVTRSFLVFTSPLLLKKPVRMAFTSLLGVEKEKPGLMLPSALRVVDSEGTRVFTNFIYFDQAFASIHELWRIQSAIAVALLSPPRTPYRDASRATTPVPVVRPLLSSLNVPSDPVRTPVHACVPIADRGPDCVTIRTVVVSSPVGAVRSLLRSEDTWRKFHDRDGHLDVVVGAWQHDLSSGFLKRTVTSRRPLSAAFAAFGADSARLEAEHRYALCDESTGRAAYLIETRASGIPYADCFTVSTQIDLIPTAESRTEIVVAVEAVFLKRTLLRSTIQKNVVREAQESYALLQDVVGEGLELDPAQWPMPTQTGAVTAKAAAAPQRSADAVPLQYRSHRHFQTLSTFCLAVCLVALFWLLLGGGQRRASPSEEMAEIRQVLQDMRRAIGDLDDGFQALAARLGRRQ